MKGSYQKEPGGDWYIKNGDGTEHRLIDLAPNLEREALTDEKYIASRTNQSPAATLELTKDEAELMLKNCESNMALGLAMMMPQPGQPHHLSRETIMKLVEYQEFFKKIRASLINQGIRID